MEIKDHPFYGRTVSCKCQDFVDGKVIDVWKTGTMYEIENEGIVGTTHNGGREVRPVLGETARVVFEDGSTAWIETMKIEFKEEKQWTH